MATGFGFNMPLSGAGGVPGVGWGGGTSMGATAPPAAHLEPKKVPPPAVEGNPTPTVMPGRPDLAFQAQEAAYGPASLEPGAPIKDFRLNPEGSRAGPPSGPRAQGGSQALRSLVVGQRPFRIRPPSPAQGYCSDRSGKPGSKLARILVHSSFFVVLWHPRRSLETRWCCDVRLY